MSTTMVFAGPLLLNALFTLPELNLSRDGKRVLPLIQS